MNTWKEIGKDLSEHPTVCMKRWKAIRDRFVRLKKKMIAIKHGEDSSERHSLPLYYTQLSWLHGYVKHRGLENGFYPSNDTELDECAPLPSPEEEPSLDTALATEIVEELEDSKPIITMQSHTSSASVQLSKCGSTPCPGPCSWSSSSVPLKACSDDEGMSTEESTGSVMFPSSQSAKRRRIASRGEDILETISSLRQEQMANYATLASKLNANNSIHNRDEFFNFGLALADSLRKLPAERVEATKAKLFAVLACEIFEIRLQGTAGGAGRTKKKKVDSSACSHHCSVMSGPQHLRLLVGQRLAAAAEEIFGLVEKTIAEYQDEVVRSKKEIVQLEQELKQLTVLKSTVILHRADVPPTSLQECDTKVKQIPILKDTEIQDNTQVKEEHVDPSMIPDMDAGTSNRMTVIDLPSEPNAGCQLLPAFISVTESETGIVVEELNESNDSSASGQSDADAAWIQVEALSDEKSCRVYDIQPDCEELLPSLQKHESKVEQMYCVETEKDHMQVKEEPVDSSVIPKMEASNSSSVTAMLLQSDPATDCQLFPPSSAVTPTVNDSIDDKCVESDGSLSPNQTHSVRMELEQSYRDDKTCRFCGEVFHRDSDLIRHVDVSHAGQKAFKCVICNKGFGRRDTLVLHTYWREREPNNFVAPLATKQLGQDCVGVVPPDEPLTNG
ncbi:hypothetical protein LDENG_00249930 [Lucifuga dentata]|nr:hypothetical protein LDENG_00249930 [Lucifuga dentata]